MMSSSREREEARLYFIPFILGSNRSSHSLAVKIFRKYGIFSCVLDKKRSFFDPFDPTSRYIRLFGESSELLCEQLIDLAGEEPYTLPLLIPTTAEYTQAIGEQRARLEGHFVICEPEKLFKSSPMSDFFG